MARTAGGGGGHKVYRRTPLRLRVPDKMTYPESTYAPSKPAAPKKKNEVVKKGSTSTKEQKLYRKNTKIACSRCGRQFCAGGLKYHLQHQVCLKGGNKSKTVRVDREECRILVEEIFKRHGVVSPFPNTQTGLPRGVARRTKGTKTCRSRPFEARFNIRNPSRPNKNLYIGSFDTIEEASLAHEKARKIITNAMINHHEIEDLDRLFSHAKQQALDAAEHLSIETKSLQDMPFTSNDGAPIGEDESAAGSSGSATIPSPLPTDDELKDTNTGEDDNNITVEGDDSIGVTGEVSATTPSVPSLQHPHVAGVVDANDCWESTFISAFKLLPTDVIMPCIDNPYWSGNARMLRLIAVRQSEYDAAVAAGSDLAQELIVRQIFMSLRLGSLVTRFLVIVPNEILKIAGGPSDRVYWPVAGDNIVLNEIRLELKRANAKQQDETNWVQEQSAPMQEIAHDDGKSYGLAQAILDLMEEDIAGEDINVNEQNTKNTDPTIEEDLAGHSKTK